MTVMSYTLVTAGEQYVAHLAVCARLVCKTLLVAHHDRDVNSREKFAYSPHHPDHGQNKVPRDLVFGGGSAVNNRYPRNLEPSE